MYGFADMITGATLGIVRTGAWKVHEARKVYDKENLAWLDRTCDMMLDRDKANDGVSPEIKLGCFCDATVW